MSSKFSMRVDEGETAVVLNGHGSGHRDVRIALDLSAPNGVTELYVGRGFVPTPEHYSARQREWSAPDTSANARAYERKIVLRAGT